MGDADQRIKYSAYISHNIKSMKFLLLHLEHVDSAIHMTHEPFAQTHLQVKHTIQGTGTHPDDIGPFPPKLHNMNCHTPKTAQEEPEECDKG